MKNSVKGTVVNSSLVIDLANLHKNYLGRHNQKISYEKLIAVIREKHTLVNIFGFGTQRGESESFCHALERLGMQVNLVPLDHRVSLAVCLTQLATPIVILASDDFSYNPALHVKRVEGKYLVRYSCYNQPNNIFHENVELKGDLCYVKPEQQLELSAASPSPDAGNPF